jgi:hypothetical protein
MQPRASLPLRRRPGPRPSVSRNDVDPMRGVARNGSPPDRLAVHPRGGPFDRMRASQFSCRDSSTDAVGNGDRALEDLPGGTLGQFVHQPDVPRILVGDREHRDVRHHHCDAIAGPNPALVQFERHDGTGGLEFGVGELLLAADHRDPGGVPLGGRRQEWSPDSSHLLPTDRSVATVKFPTIGPSRVQCQPIDR